VALVSEADFIAAQDTAVPRGPAGPAVRRYLLAGLIACGWCGRRLESCWSAGRPAYRCRHGYSSAAVPDPARLKNTYVREDQILPHLAAVAILLTGDDSEPEPGDRGLAQLTGPDRTADLIDQLRADGTVLTYHPDDHTLSAGDRGMPSVIVANDHQYRTSERRTA
jgi:site-specific DNA recombinase